MNNTVYTKGQSVIVTETESVYYNQTAEIIKADMNHRHELVLQLNIDGKELWFSPDAIILLETKFPICSSVEVNDPEIANEFVGTVSDYRNGNLIVEDADSDFFEVEPRYAKIYTGE